MHLLSQSISNIIVALHETNATHFLLSKSFFSHCDVQHEPLIRGPRTLGYHIEQRLAVCI